MALGFGMKMELQQFLDVLASSPEKIEFETTMAVIEDNYDFTPAAFTNGNTQNGANENNGSCKNFCIRLIEHSR